jgi:hypothetical protein
LDFDEAVRRCLMKEVPSQSSIPLRKQPLIDGSEEKVHFGFVSSTSDTSSVTET